MTHYHYIECGLNNVYLINGFKYIETPRGKSISIKDIDGLHKAIGLYLVTSKKDLSGDELRFLRHDMLISQATLARLVGISEQAIRRWERGKIMIPKPSESLIRLLYREHAQNKDEKIMATLKEISDLEDRFHDRQLLFKDTSRGWRSAA
ncbi:MAG: helix-turn-helix domain-containing protein [Parachlamydia sp.]|nr:helix-turn-helix domain-containing protein [Parachlamydia sp.]